MEDKGKRTILPPIANLLIPLLPVLKEVQLYSHLLRASKANKECEIIPTNELSTIRPLR